MPAPTGKALAEEIAAATTAEGELAFWWLGQHGFVLRLGEAAVAMDPFLTDGPARTVRPVLAPEDLAGVAVVTGSHDHGDHIDRGVWPAIAEAAPHATFVVPRLILQRRLAREMGMDAGRLIGLDDGESAEVGGVRITAVAAAHERLDVDDATGLHPYLGFVVEGNGCRVYHAGDTCRYEGLLGRLRRPGRLDVMFLPINGRDARRLAGGCIGNMTYQEAVDLAGEVAPRVAVPAHFEMFTHNSEDPQRFVEYMRVKYPDVATVVPVHGRRVRVGPGGVEVAPAS